MGGSYLGHYSDGLKDMTILYAPSAGLAVADGHVEQWYQDLLKQDTPFCQVGTDLMVTRCRVGRKEGDVTGLIVKYRGVPYGCDENGLMEDGYWQAVGDAGPYASYLLRILD